jgi:hypothetical protein
MPPDPLEPEILHRPIGFAFVLHEGRSTDA